MALLLHNGWHTPHSPGAGGVLIKLGHMKPFPPLLVLLGSTISSHPSRFIKALPLYRRWSKGYCEWKRFPWKKEKKKVETIECISNLWSGQVCGSFMVPRYQNGVRGHWRSNSAQSSEVEVTVQYFLPVSSTLATSSDEYEHKYSRLQPRTPYHTAGSGWQHAFSNKLII